MHMEVDVSFLYFPALVLHIIEYIDNPTSLVTGDPAWSFNSTKPGMGFGYGDNYCVWDV